MIELQRTLIDSCGVDVGAHLEFGAEVILSSDKSIVAGDLSLCLTILGTGDEFVLKAPLLKKGQTHRFRSQPHFVASIPRHTKTMAVLSVVLPLNTDVQGSNTYVRMVQTP